MRLYFIDIFPNTPTVILEFANRMSKYPGSPMALVDYQDNFLKNVLDQNEKIRGTIKEYLQVN